MKFRMSIFFMATDYWRFNGNKSKLFAPGLPKIPDKR
jgi:hypothetical protein